MWKRIMEYRLAKNMKEKSLKKASPLIETTSLMIYRLTY